MSSGQNYQLWYMAITLTDLNPCGFLFWGCLKAKVHNSNPRTKELDENICREMANIPAEQLQRVNWNLFRRYEDCPFSTSSVICEL
jgi:hypothetical protein